MTSFVVPSTMI